MGRHPEVPIPIAPDAEHLTPGIAAAPVAPGYVRLMRRVAPMAAIALGVLAVACSSTTAPRDSAPAGISISAQLPAALRAAVDRTLTVRSARAETTSPTTITTALYQAPDRAMVVRRDATAQSNVPVTITLVETYVGDRVYTQFGPEPVTVTTRPAKPRISGHLVALNQVFQPVLVLAHASKVTGSAATYQFETVIYGGTPGTPDVTETGTVHLRDGMIVTIEEAVPLPSPAGLEHRATVFSQFGTAPPVVTPTVGGQASTGDVMLAPEPSSTTPP